MGRMVTLLLGTALVTACIGEKESCTASENMGLSVHVIDRGGQPVCDVTVVAEEGSYREELDAWNCSYSGATERPGRYTVSALREGEVVSSDTVTVGFENTCGHVITEELTLVAPQSPECDEWCRVLFAGCGADYVLNCRRDCGEQISWSSDDDCETEARAYVRCLAATAPDALSCLDDGTVSEPTEGCEDEHAALDACEQ